MSILRERLVETLDDNTEEKKVVEVLIRLVPENQQVLPTLCCYVRSFTKTRPETVQKNLKSCSK